MNGGNFEEPEFVQVSDDVWEIPQSYKEGMRVPARIFASKELLGGMDKHVFQQVTNVATLPGIVDASMCMPDGHSGYGFPIGGVAATDVEEGGVISPGGIGFDINCGMRLIRTDLTWDDIEPHIKELVDKLFDNVPAGVGSSGIMKLDASTFREMLMGGAEWMVEEGYGWEDDLEHTEEQGNIDGTDETKVSDKAVERGKSQLGTLGSGNHYLEIQVLDEENIVNEGLAKQFGLFPNQVVVMFHCGSRGFGHQVATDYLNECQKVMTDEYGIQVPDRELACVPFDSPEGQDYFEAMKCAINFSFASRQRILHTVRQVFSDVLNQEPEAMGMEQIYDVAHNTAKLEEYEVDGERRKLLVHRKGATRSLAPGNPLLPEAYTETGQPVIIGGSMQTGSWLLVGTEEAERKTFGSTAHGAGRTMSRTQAKKEFYGKRIKKKMEEEQNIYVRSVSFPGLAEEAGGAYKDVDEVIDTTDRLNLSKKVARFRPVGNIKG